MRSRHIYWFGLIFILVIQSCSNTDSNHKKIFRYNQPQQLTSLDPAFARNQSNIWAVNHLYNTLVQLDDSLHLQPCIAHSWSIADGGRRITFLLRNDVYFHDDPCFNDGKGRRVVARDFVYSFQRIIDSTVNSPGSWVFIGRVRDSLPFVARNDSTFEIYLKEPFMPFLQILSMQYCSVVPHEAVEKYGLNFRSHPVGTGPFRFVRWIEGQVMILARNEHYFEKINGQQLPYLDGIRIEFIGDRKAAFLQLLEGGLDYINGFDPSMAFELFDRDGLLRKKYSDKVRAYKAPYLNTEYLGFNLEKIQNSPFLSDPRFRKALNYGFNRAEMLKTIRRGIGHPAISSFVPFGLPSYDEKKVPGYHYDPEESRQLLDECGYSKLPMDKRPLLTILTPKDYSDYCLFIIRQWESLGIKCKIDVAEAATIREMVRNGKASFFRASWLADYSDAENYLTCFYGENSAPPNYTRFKNARFDALYSAALSETDEVKRMALYQEMQRIIVDDVPVIFLFYDEVRAFTTLDIENYHPNSLNILKVKYIKKK
jgi:peptide/nickel transport system substrate-binding protein